MAYSFDRLQVEADGRIVFVTISNPPVNVITGELFAELNAFSQELKADSDRTVAVFKSADPDFFLAHFDVSAILWKHDYEPQRDAQLKGFHALCERFRLMNKVCIAQIEGVSAVEVRTLRRFGYALWSSRQNRYQSNGSPLGILPGGAAPNAYLG